VVGYDTWLPLHLRVLILFLGVASVVHGALFTYPAVWVFGGGIIVLVLVWLGG
jgi:hypothetical protein